MLLYNSGFPLYFLSCWQLLQQRVACAGPSREHQPSEWACVVWGCVGLGTNPRTAFTLPCCAHLGEGTSNSFTPFMETWKLLVPGHDAPRLALCPCRTLTNAVQTTWRQGRSIHQAGSTEQCAKQGPLWWPAGNMWDSSWGWIVSIIKT